MDRLNLLKPITIDKKAVWREKRKSGIQSVEAGKQNNKGKRVSNNVYVLDEHKSKIQPSPVQKKWLRGLGPS